MGLHHHHIVATSSQTTVTVGFILGLGTRDGEDRFVSRDGAREANRDPRISAVCAVDQQSGSLAWGLLEPAVVLTGSD